MGEACENSPSLGTVPGPVEQGDVMFSADLSAAFSSVRTLVLSRRISLSCGGSELGEAEVEKSWEPIPTTLEQRC